MKVRKSSLALVGPAVITLACWAASPAGAWSWPWKKADTATQTPPPSAPPATAPLANSPASAPAATATAASTETPASSPASPTAAKSHHSRKLVGTIETIDASSGMITLKTKSGKSESFALAPSAKVLRRRTPSSLDKLKAGDRVSVRYDSGEKQVTEIDVH